MPARSILRILKPLVSSEAMSNERYLTIAQVLFFYFYTNLAVFFQKLAIFFTENKSLFFSDPFIKFQQVFRLF